MSSVRPAGPKKMNVVALAPRALSCPHPYDPTNEGEPRWTGGVRERV